MGLEQHSGTGLTVWSYRLSAPYRFERCDIPEKTPESLGDGQVLLRFLAAGICGSDLPGFKGIRGKLSGDTGASAAEMDGYPIHEIVGEVIASRHDVHQQGDKVVGWASGFDGLMAHVVTDGNGLAPYDPALSPAMAAGLQPLACVLHVLQQMPTVAGSHVAVIGQGPIGLLFSYAAKALGAREVTGVDPVDRTDIGPLFGVDTIVRSTSDRWVNRLDPQTKPDIVIEAVGHQVATLNHAVSAVTPGGTIFYFGVPDDESYAISMRTMLRNNLTLKSGITLDRMRALRCADDFARQHPELLPNYLTHTFAVNEVQGAFELACRATPQRIKIALTP